MCVIMMPFNEVVNFMSKINISTILNSIENGITNYNGVGILKDNEIIFYENNIKVTIIINDNTVCLKRIHDDYIIELPFENSLTKNGIYDIKSDGMQIPIEVTTNVLNVKEGSIHIEYNLILGGVNQGSFVYDIKYEVII